MYRNSRKSRPYGVQRPGYPYRRDTPFLRLDGGARAEAWQKYIKSIVQESGGGAQLAKHLPRMKKSFRCIAEYPAVEYQGSTLLCSSTSHRYKLHALFHLIQTRPHFGVLPQLKIESSRARVGWNDGAARLDATGRCTAILYSCSN